MKPLLLPLFAYIPVCLAGLQVPLLIINLSPNPAFIDMRFEPRCMKGSFNPKSLEYYYQTWASSNTTLRAKYSEKELPNEYLSYLQEFKGLTGIDNLGSRRYSMYGGSAWLPAVQYNQSVPFGVFETEVNGANDCWGNDAFKHFSITSGSTNTYLKLYDPWDDHWQIIKNSRDWLNIPDRNEMIIDIGPGGRADPIRVVVDAVVLAGSIALAVVGAPQVSTGLNFLRLTYISVARAGVSMAASGVLGQIVRKIIIGGVLVAVGAGGISAVVFVPGRDSLDGVTSNVAIQALSFDSVYKNLDVKHREACLMGENIMGHFDCRVAGTSLVIQGDGSVFAMPLPPIHRGWD